MKALQQIRALEESARLPEGHGERFNGYGIMGVPFSSGHVLALRRFFKSSIGPGYTTIWHRNEKDEWTFYSDKKPEMTCPRFFGRRIKNVIVGPISIRWNDQDRLNITIRGVDFDWQVQVMSTPMTSFLNLIRRIIPDPLWKNPQFLDFMAITSRITLGTGKIKLHGRVPNGQRFRINLKKIWMIKDSMANIQGKDLGSPGRLEPQAQLGDLRIPNKGILASGKAYFEPLDPSRHYTCTTSGE